MKSDFNHPRLQGNFAPILAECDAPELIVLEGELPAGLNGTLYRNGPNPMFPPLGPSHDWFLGEGMLHAITLANGKASYRNRWVRTEQYAAQRAAGRRLVPTTFGGAPAPGGETVRRNTANTNIITHAGKMMALEEVDLPVIVDPDSLMASGSHDYDGRYRGPFSGHPKLDDETGELLTFGYMADGPGSSTLSFTIVGADGRIKRHDRFPAPYPAMMHDFLVTAEHALFPVFPATIDGRRLAAGGSLIAWDPSLKTHIGILGRNAPVDTIRWFEGDPCYAYHMVNAYLVRDRGAAKLLADVFKFDRVGLFPNADGSAPEVETDTWRGKLVRWTFDLNGAANTFNEDPLADIPGELGRFDDRFTGRPYRHVYYGGVTGEAPAGAPANSLVHHDLLEGVTKSWSPKGGHVLEPVFVPRHPKAAEGDGWVLSVTYDIERNLSDFVVFDASNIDAGPVARVELPTRVPFGFHGNWVQKTA